MMFPRLRRTALPLCARSYKSGQVNKGQISDEACRQQSLVVLPEMPLGSMIKNTYI